MRTHQRSPKTQDTYLRIVREFAQFPGRHVWLVPCRPSAQPLHNHMAGRAGAYDCFSKTPDVPWACRFYPDDEITLASTHQPTRTIKPVKAKLAFKLHDTQRVTLDQRDFYLVH